MIFNPACDVLGIRYVCICIHVKCACICIGECVYDAYECVCMYHTLVRWRGERDWPVKIG